MWRDIWSQIALKCTQGFIKERSYLTARSVTRHFKAFKPLATFDAGECLFSFVNPCLYFKSICGCMPVLIWMHEMNHMEKAICLLKMWRDISSQIALKCTQGFIKERSYLTARSMTRHFKAFKPFATFDAGECFFSFVNPCVYFKSICACSHLDAWNESYGKDHLPAKNVETFHHRLL